MEGTNVLPVGFRFHPTDEELIDDYLKKKVSGTSNPYVSIIADVDLYKFHPWELPAKACFGEKEWFFFNTRERKYPNGARPNRAAASGYWKATGSDKPILSRFSRCIGVKKSLVFYEGQAPSGRKTSWMMDEFRLHENNGHIGSRSLMQRGSMKLDEWVLCRVRLRAAAKEQEHRQEDTKKKRKRQYQDDYDGFMEDESAYNISFAQQNDWYPQQDYHSNDHSLILDFEEGSSSSHSLSYDDSQLSANGSMNQTLDDMKMSLAVGAYDEIAPNQTERMPLSDPSTFLENNICSFQLFST